MHGLAKHFVVYVPLFSTYPYTKYTLYTGQAFKIVEIFVSEYLSLVKTAEQEDTWGYQAS